MYSSKSRYVLAKLRSHENTNDFNWQTNVWNVKTSPKVKFFLWKLVSKSLSVGNRLVTCSVNDDAYCKRCGEREYEVHIFLTCSHITQLGRFSLFCLSHEATLSLRLNSYSNQAA